MKRMARLNGFLFVSGLGLLAGAYGACGGENKLSGNDDGGTVTLRIEPADTSVVADGTTKATVDYRVIATDVDGERDVTDEVDLSVQPSEIGRFEGGKFTTSNAIGGRATVRGTLDEARAEASITVRLKQLVVVPPTGGGTPLPASPETLFGGSEDAARAPTLVYPNSGVVIPPNLNRLEIHWLRGPETNTLFEVSFTNDISDIRAYVRCERPATGVQADGCIWQPDSTVWHFLSETNRGEQELTIKVRATDDTGTSVGSSGTNTMSFGQTNLAGTLYYWAATTGKIVRYDFGAAADEFETALGPDLVQAPAGDKCVGCHAMSRDGTKIATSATNGAGGFLLYNLETGTTLRNNTSTTDEVFAFGTFNPDGTQLAAVSTNTLPLRMEEGLLLFDTRCDVANMATCGQEVDRIALDGTHFASHPDWSADGARIAFTYAALGVPHSVAQSGIAYVQRTADGWSEMQEWVPYIEGKSRYNPSFAPDSTFIVFDESTCIPGMEADGGDNCDGNQDPTAKVFAIRRESGEPVLLANANAQGALDTNDRLTNTFPRIAPFASVWRRGEDQELLWVTISTKRRYGLRSPVGTQAWIWMFAVRPSELEAGNDPSFPAFALPFQDFSTGNHIAAWTERAVPIL